MGQGKLCSARIKRSEILHSTSCCQLAFFIFANLVGVQHQYKFQWHFSESALLLISFACLWQINSFTCQLPPMFFPCHLLGVSENMTWIYWKVAHSGGGRGESQWIWGGAVQSDHFAMLGLHLHPTCFNVKFEFYQLKLGSIGPVWIITAVFNLNGHGHSLPSGKSNCPHCPNAVPHLHYLYHTRTTCAQTPLLTPVVSWPKGKLSAGAETGCDHNIRGNHF